MAQEYLSNHILSASHSGRFSDDHDVLTAVNLRTGRKYPTSARSAAARNNFWEASEPARAQIETSFSLVERQAPQILDEYLADPDLARNSEVRGVIAELIAIHAIRNPASRRQYLSNHESSLSRRESQLREDLGPAYESFVDEINSPESIALGLASQVRLGVALFISMHWTLIRFEEPCLGIADQPLFRIPNVVPGTHLLVDSAHPAGMIDTLEFRFNLDPQSCLLLTWQEGSDLNDRFGTMREAADINRASLANADVEFLHGTHYQPPFVAPPEVDRRPVVPLAWRYLPGYGYSIVIQSDRRRNAMAILDDLVENPDKSSIEFPITA